MSKNYLIKLRPLEPFFFGGEYTFGKDDTRGKDEGSRYFAKSELFPQQSAILGMLRKTILNKKNILTLHKKGEWIDGKKNANGEDSKNHKEANHWVGRGTFSYESDFDIGKVIENISPAFISKDEKNYFLEANDSEFTPKESSFKMIINNKEQNVIVFDGYDAKNQLAIKLVPKSDELKLFDVYKSIQTVGIKKAEKDDAFFLKESYHFENNERFAFIVKSSKDLQFLDKTLVALGADQSSFMMEVISDYNSFEEITKDIYLPKKDFDRVVLLSETLLTKKAYELCRFIFGDRKTMRHLTQNEQKNQKKQKKSKRYYLLQRGTVIYTDDLEKLDKELDITYLKKVGINSYKKIEKGESNA